MELDVSSTALKKAWPDRWRQVICQKPFVSTSSGIDSPLILSSLPVRQPSDTLLHFLYLL